MFLYQLIDLDKSLRPSPLPTPRPRSVCVRSGLTVESAPLEAAEARHGGDSCVLWEFLSSRQNLIAVNSLTAICNQAGTKNYPSVDFLRRNSTFFLVSTTDKQHHHGELPPPPAAGFNSYTRSSANARWTSGWGRGWSKRFTRID